MSSVPHPSDPLVPERERSPFPSGVLAQAATAAALLGIMTTFLVALGRPFVCPCGHVSLWQAAGRPIENSQQFLDWYSLLHVAFGMGLYAFVRVMRPHWTLGSTLLAVVLGHAIWEVAENTPWIIDVFAGGSNAPFYGGDSILNSFGDTVSALAGALAAPVLPFWAAGLLVIGIEIAVTLGANDGFVIGTLRLLGVPA